MLTTMISNARAFARDHRGAAAVIVALTLPVMLGTTALALDAGLSQVKLSTMEAVADAAAGAARSLYDPFTPFEQTAPVTEALRIAAANNASGILAKTDVVQGWWDITKNVPEGTDRFGPPVDGQTGNPFSNAIRVTVRQTYTPALGQLFGFKPISMTKQSTAYKCSNTDYPLTLIADDVPSPSLPALYMSWATPGHDASTSYYYLQADGSHNPIFKFYSPYDGQDVSFVLVMSNGYELQVDTYCAGTYLVSPAAFDSRNFRNGDGSPATITGYLLRGSTNNSFDTYGDQSKYPFAFAPTPYNTANEVQTPQYDLSKIKTTPYPSAYGTQYWASEGNPTPDRRALLVYNDSFH